MYAIRSNFCSNLFYFKTRCIAPLVICFPSSRFCFPMDFIYEEHVAPPVTSNVKDENDTDNTSDDAQVDGYEVLAPLQNVKDEVVEEHVGSHSRPANVEAKVEAQVEAKVESAAAAVPTGHAAPVSSCASKIEAIVSAAEADRDAVGAPMVPRPPAYPPPATVAAASAASSGESGASPAGQPASVTINISWSQVVYYDDPVKGKVLDVRHPPISSPYPNLKFSGYQVSKCNEFVSVVFVDPDQLSTAGARRQRPSGRECKAAKRRRDSVASSSSSAWSSWNAWDSWGDASWGDSSWSSAQWTATAHSPKFDDCPWNLKKGPVTYGPIDPDI
jgi:hypothetical protein